MRLLCHLTEKKDKILSAHDQIDTGNLLSNVLTFYQSYLVPRTSFPSVVSHGPCQEVQKLTDLTPIKMCMKV